MPKYVIKNVDSIPCELVGQDVTFDGQGNRLSEPIETKWPMPWLEKGISELDVSQKLIKENDTARLYNEEEPDQYVDVMLLSK
jgi:fatty-acyl-CoA synthase